MDQVQGPVHVRQVLYLQATPGPLKMLLKPVKHIQMPSIAISATFSGPWSISDSAKTSFSYP